MKNALMHKVDKKFMPLPKLIVVVPDDDIIRCLEEASQKGLTKQFSRILNYIMMEHERSVSTYKEFLLAKCLKPGYPQILWIQAPLHDNFSEANNSACYKFNKSLEEAVKVHDNISTLPFKKVWDARNFNFFIAESRRFMTDGYYAYWEAVDRTARYFDSILLKKQDKKRGHLKFSVMQKLSSTDQKDHFWWKNPAFNKDCDTQKVFCPLPPPPQ